MIALVVFTLLAGFGFVLFKMDLIWNELRRIRTVLETNLLTPVGFRVKETALGGNKMAQLQAGVKLRVLDDGKGVLYTLLPVNAAGNPVPWNVANNPIQAVSSAPATLGNAVPDPGDPNATPPRPADTTGLVFVAPVTQPVVDADNVVMTFSDTLTNGSTISTDAPGVDVAADDSPVGFSISESAL